MHHGLYQHIFLTFASYLKLLNTFFSNLLGNKISPKQQKKQKMLATRFLFGMPTRQLLRTTSSTTAAGSPMLLFRASSLLRQKPAAPGCWSHLFYSLAPPPNGSSKAAAGANGKNGGAGRNGGTEKNKVFYILFYTYYKL
jgi:hypothetical protein